MKRAMLITGIILALANSLVIACDSESIAGEYSFICQSIYSYPPPGGYTDYQIVLADRGTFNYKERDHYREVGFPSNMTGEWITGEWIIKESGEWERQGDNLYLRIDDSIIEAMIDDGKISIDYTMVYAYKVYAYANSEIPYGTWEKVK